MLCVMCGCLKFWLWGESSHGVAIASRSIHYITKFLINSPSSVMSLDGFLFLMRSV